MSRPTRVREDVPPDDWGELSRAAIPEASAHVFTVSEITRRIKLALDEFGRVAVDGEVARVVRAASGHLYFDLKDMDAKIACTVWRSQIASAVRFELAEGMRVVAHGRLDVYGPRGTYSLNVQRLEQAGLGEMLAKLEALKADLKAKGWFDRKRPLPSLPHTIGVVTSRDGAAFQDFLRTRSLRWPLYPVRLAHTPVQGAGAAALIADAIRRLDRSGVDVIVVARGGGSIEDLWAFNELPVAEAIHATSVPVVTGVGHETDVTLADLVADHRAHTPTDAAQTVIPDRARLLGELERARNYLMQAVDAALTDREQRLAHAASSPALRDASWIIDRRAQSLAAHARALRLSVGGRLQRELARFSSASTRLARQSPAVRLERASTRISAVAPRLHRALVRPIEAAEMRLRLARTGLLSTSPDRVLERGYSITRRVGVAIPLTQVEGLREGERIETRLAAGSIVSRVESAHADGKRPDGIQEETGDAPSP